MLNCMLITSKAKKLLKHTAGMSHKLTPVEFTLMTMTVTLKIPVKRYHTLIRKHLNAAQASISVPFC